ncbi:2-deoxy-D-gluconate 3-dehydrogenase [Desulfotomaculum arcticum]|uniref:2-deoxy-D-gluconate 3-dehydrogenase n=1 Tax=Desulfotruncus arcticus DSM 17038 TaxID=1121424 RepID=A0A1I2QHY1_9FIRM|nr:glucose 1-dehydrogenase [Desulfotruncus arcticus]SFG28185.1 2-deoxy-D-gluconate 3-dehydrogenase [Desulfotomaculum arcticum] [Desulfotruncus arcticus DSM 17038]
MKNLFDLSGKTAIVTGAASGLGQQIALGVAAHGANVVAVGSPRHDAKGIIEQIINMGGKAVGMQIDVTNTSEVKQMVDYALEQFGSIDIAYNVPGINIRKEALELTEEEWDRVIGINLKGVYLCAKAIGEIMVKQRSGRMINMSSIFGTVCMKKQVAYATSKGGINQMTKVLALEWAPYGITVNAIAPAYIKTPLVRQVMEDKEWYEDVKNRNAMQRLGEPEEIIGPAVFLGSDASSFITGTIIYVDGGWTML